ncbi:DUF29 domain-containing protein [uncultured Methylobacterium sp.]|uniref:DUF29 domain-containing protein n=1 Tax=uncultured Methylobacterium sp. TaxID=157278 RepID=UPI0035CB204C
MSTLLRESEGPKAPTQRSTRYADDLHAWVQEQVALLRAGRVDALDLDNIAEELSDVGAEQYDKLESAVVIVLVHVLKWDHQPERRSRSWTQSIEEHRLRIGKQLRKNPSLKSRLAEALDDGYRLGRVKAAREMKRKTRSLPADCPYTWDDILNRSFETDGDR